MDSLLDTVTNVVGILVILLAVTQIGVTSAMRRIRANLPEVSPEAYRKARHKYESQRDRLVTLIATRNHVQAQAPSEQDVQAVQQDIQDLEGRVKQLADQNAKVEALRKTLGGHKKTASELEETLKALEAKIAELKARLDDTAVPEAPPPTVVRLPDPRPAPEDAKGIWGMCRQGRCLFVPEERLQRIARESIRRAGRILLFNPEQEKGTPEFHGGKLEALFKENDIGTRNFRLRVDAHQTRTWAHLLIEPRDQAGETPEQILSSQSACARIAREARERGAYIRFMVWPDGFKAYLTARKVADHYGVPAGWVPYTKRRWRRRLHGVRVHRMKKPKPRPPRKKPDKPDKPEKPKPPPDVID
jgi:uncharacterized coiled-coil protein SlyX